MKVLFYSVKDFEQSYILHASILVWIIRLINDALSLQSSHISRERAGKEPFPVRYSSIEEAFYLFIKGIRRPVTSDHQSSDGVQGFCLALPV